MDLNLRASLADRLWGDPPSEMLNVLLATLEYPADTKTKSLKLVQDIDFFCKAQEPPREPRIVDTPPWYFWPLIMGMAACIPPDHEWQDCLVQTMDILRQRDESNKDEQETARFEYLEESSLAVSEQINYCYISGCEETASGGAIAKWKNFNSFIARTSTPDGPWRMLCIWEFRETLEEPVIKAAAMECKLWVTTEWIIRCAGIIFEEMNYTGEIDDDTAQSFRMGPSCDAKRVLSLERWEFWKKRLAELVADAGKLELGSTITARISKALEAMAAVEP
ncbi:hypothetical protein FALBO_802 [Fusarium albosuccineum]|uniref:Uncharacterized protein n=1 Tax=Fusarium albosuccineum TaxID=1237068 RepID=A0A8H4PE63_9HYPO|nr:hypothetical protein FALBO_802 [Fusarium albosuccineum]